MESAPVVINSVIYYEELLNVKKNTKDAEDENKTYKI